jgi:hypothetical protein
MIRDIGLPVRLQVAADHFITQVPEKGEAVALSNLREVNKVEHPVVRQAAEDPVFWRIFAVEPRFTGPKRVAAALRWYGVTPETTSEKELALRHSDENREANE